MRVVTRILLYVLAVLVVLGPAAYFARDVLPARIVTWALPAVLGVSGIGTVSLKVDSVGLDRIVLSNVRLGDRPDFTAGRIVAEYEPLALLRGAVSSIEVRDALVRGRLDAGGGFSFGALDPLIALAGGGGNGASGASDGVGGAGDDDGT